MTLISTLRITFVNIVAISLANREVKHGDETCMSEEVTIYGRHMKYPTLVRPA